MKLLTTLLACAFTAATFAQTSGREARAEKRMSAYDYPGAIDLLAGIEPATPGALSKLATCYRLTGQYTEAVEAYRSLDAMDGLYPMETYYLAALERTQGNYEESNLRMAEFAQKVGDDSRAAKTLASPDYFETLRNAEVQASVRHLSINSEDQDFAPSLYLDQVVFASSRHPVGPVSRTYNRTGLPFLDLYAATVCGQDGLCDVMSFDRKLSGRYHDGPAAFDASGEVMVFTRNNATTDATGTRRLMLFECTRTANGWSEPEPLAINSPTYNVGHAAFANDGDILLFASDMPGGFGGTDLYMMHRARNGGWLRPMNLGPAVNSEGNEMFPFVDDGGMLFFASDGLPGLGGLDVFVTQWTDHPEGIPRNLGFPINDTHDDFGLVMKMGGTEGYFTSNRPGGAGDDDLYAFSLEEPIDWGIDLLVTVVDQDEQPLANVGVVCTDPNGAESTFVTDSQGRLQTKGQPASEYAFQASLDGYFDGSCKTQTGNDREPVSAKLVLRKDPGLALFCRILDAQTGEPVEGAAVSLASQNSLPGFALQTDTNGEILEPLEAFSLGQTLKYTVTLAREGYVTKTMNYTQPLNREGTYALHEALDVALEPMTVGADLGTLIDINPIYFDLNKAIIRADAANELDKIVAIMNEHPTLEIELGSHTDCRGSAAYNEKLSDRRAKSSAAYIQARISNPERITGKGYGENRLVNECACEGGRRSPCGEDAHQENRRTEFVITKM